MCYLYLFFVSANNIRVRLIQFPLCQGMTLNKVILALGKRPNKLTDLEYDSLYVAFSRVQKRDDIRILIPAGAMVGGL